MDQPVIQLRGVTTRFGSKLVHRDLDLDVRRGEVLALVGGSGSGKTTLLRHMIGLTEPSAGTVRVLGEQLDNRRFMAQRSLRRRWGVLFQFGALFSSLTVLDNVCLPLRERGGLPDDMVASVARLKLAQAGLAPADAWKYPAELSGGMVKRVALARALALDPELLFLDEPTSGLDPVGAQAFVELMLETRERDRPTIVMVTHELGRMERLVDRVAVLADQTVVAVGPPREVARVPHPFIQSYFGAEFGADAIGEA